MVKPRRTMKNSLGLVENRHPIPAAVNCFPNAAGNRAEIVSIELISNAFDGEYAATTERSDLSPLHSAPQFFIELRLCLRR